MSRGVPGPPVTARPQRQRMAGTRAPDGPLLDWLLVLVLVGGYVALQTLLLRPPVLSDQIHYFADAAALPDVDPVAGDPGLHRALRLGLVLPVRAAIAVFGYSEAAYYAIPYLAGVVLVAATYAVGRLLFDRDVAVLASVLVFANPFVLSEASHLLPDLPATALVTAAMALAVAGGRRAEHGALQTSGAAAALFASGLLFGWAYLVREFVVVLAPVLLLVLVAYRIPLAWRLRVFAAAAVALVVEWLWAALVHGNPLARVAAALGRPPSPPWRQAQVDRLRAEGAVPEGPADLLLALPRALVEWWAGWAVLALAAALVVAAIGLRQRRFIVLGAWLLMPLVLLLSVVLLSDAVLRRPLLRPQLVRYWFPLWPAVAVGGVAALRQLATPAGFTQRAGTAALTVLAGATVLLSVVQVGVQPWFVRTGADHFQQLRAWLSQDGAGCTVLWTDDDHWRASTLVLPIYTRTTWGAPLWDGRIQRLNRGDRWLQVDDIREGAVVVHRTAVNRLLEERREVPGYLRSSQALPAGWTVALATDNEEIAVLFPAAAACGAEALPQA